MLTGFGRVVCRVSGVRTAPGTRSVEGHVKKERGKARGTGWCYRRNVEESVEPFKSRRGPESSL